MSHAYTSFPPRTSISRSLSLSSQAAIPRAPSPFLHASNLTHGTDPSCTGKAQRIWGASQGYARRHIPRRRGSSRHAPPRLGPRCEIHSNERQSPHREGPPCQDLDGSKEVG